MRKEILIQELKDKLSVLEVSSDESFDLHLNEMKNLISMYKHEKRRELTVTNKSWIDQQMERLHF
jgi:hypothetical protein